MKAVWNVREDVSTPYEDQGTQKEQRSYLVISETDLWSPHSLRRKCSSWIWFIVREGVWASGTMSLILSVTGECHWDLEGKVQRCWKSRETWGSPTKEALFCLKCKLHSSWGKDSKNCRNILFSHCFGYQFCVINSQSPTYEPSSCELSKMWTCIPSTSGVSEAAACPPSPTAEDLSAVLSSHLSLRQSVTLLACSSRPAPVYQLLYCTTILFQGTVL